MSTCARKFADHFAVSLTKSWEQWFDEAHGLMRHGQRSNGGEFFETIDPESLIAGGDGRIWPGFMLPDTLPVLGNAYGDWLCLRVTAENTIGEVLHWYHGGGDWIPWGANIPEGILFDRMRDRFPGRRVDYAVRPVQPSPRGRDDPLLEWALQYVPSPLQAAWENNARGDELLSTLLEAGCCEYAVLAEQVLLATDGVLRQSLDQAIAETLGLPWEPLLLSWTFDERLVDEQYRESLLSSIARRAKLSPDRSPSLSTDPAHPELNQQDWEKVVVCCQRVVRKRRDLGWAWDLLGWAAEQHGDIVSAAEYYSESLLASSFSDQSIRFRTHWFPERYGKFAAFRLTNLQSQLSSLPTTAIQSCYLHNQRGLRERVYAYWLNLANECRDRNQPNQEYEMLYRAGWDLGISDLAQYRELLQRMVEVAQRGGEMARARVAAAHLVSLENG